MMLSLARCTELCGGDSEVVKAAGKLHHVRFRAGAPGLFLGILTGGWGRVGGFCYCRTTSVVATVPSFVATTPSVVAAASSVVGPGPYVIAGAP